MRRSLRRWGIPVLFSLAAAMVTVAAAGALRSFGQERGDWATTPLALAGLLLAAQVACLALAWRLILRRADPDVTTPTGTVTRAFLLGWVSRYVPGPPAGFAGKYIVCRQAGHGRGALAAALFYENALLLVATAAVPTLTLGFVAPRLVFVVAVPLGALLVAAGLGLRPAVIRGAVSLVARRVHRAGEWRPIPLSRLLAPWALMVAAALLSGLAFHVVAVTLTDVPPENVVSSVAIFSVAALAGFVTPLAPSGAGVREAVIVALLGPSIGRTDALSAAIVARAIAVMLDAGIAGALGGAYAWAWLQRSLPAWRLRTTPKYRA